MNLCDTTPFNYIFDSSFDSLVLRISKGQTRTNLVSEYSRLGKPGANKSLLEVIKAVELEMSANVTFELEEIKTESGKIDLYLKTGKSSVRLPDQKWNKQVYLDPKTSIPFVSDGKTSVHCIQFFQQAPAQTPEVEMTAPAPPPPPTPTHVPLPNERPKSLGVPLPGPSNPIQFSFGGLRLFLFFLTTKKRPTQRKRGKKEPPRRQGGSFLRIFLAFWGMANQP